MISDNHKSEIKKLLNEEITICYEILDYTQKFENLIESDEFNKATDIMKESLEKANKVPLIEKKINSIINENKISKDSLKNEFGSYIEKISKTLNEISELDDKIDVLINKKKDFILEDLKNLRVGKSFYKEYLSSLKGNKGYIDIKE
jgi:hypothetical protein